ncbi:D-3-phosphoglycerate dehydrogenase 2 [Dimargaris cristalligena]|uniref:D-3-phosphoglycerate dehydrogenase 1 n=1 Tax=Dimargaris cristalligena TaxID=215637 RepID=A0A4P9ZSA5_9FUNG|nr:D-3-phosphoglycerate dehydrogenase 2 [Dimargaris cristalligena]RKP36424.1 D-3-phosphoglycerate dehydrogenase 1 [Dimargaris cristalligena]|eukprot:RKP36424.1 D-3-phosphoglycerate dehydrogenase 1 [Dimargaris cristalligena]
MGIPSPTGLTMSTRRASPPYTERALKPFGVEDVRILLLENINQTAVDILRNAGYQVEHHTKALSEDLLIEKIQHAHVIGIRSKTRLTANILKHAHSLLAIGCFCIGTNQVDLEYAAERGISVFNSPFSNSRSVAEMTIGNIITLARQIGDRNKEMHTGGWFKVSANCYEIRGKTLGIVGYGHIGSQLSVMAESLGMVVRFFDVLQLMPLGTSKPTDSLEELLRVSDFVTLHVPETPETKNMVGEREIGLMKPGSYLLNASRGTVVDIPALAAALRSKHLAGSAIDVYPSEPFGNGQFFESELIGCPNTILTPHIGGSTEEAQSMIGIEVANAMIRFINVGTTLNAVNFPQVDLRAISAAKASVLRLVNVHRNVPGVLRQINNILGPFNVEKQVCDNKDTISYFMADITIGGVEDIQTLYDRISSINENILTRVLY